MARSQIELQGILKAIDGVVDAYIQPPTTMQFPCIKIERGLPSDTHFADDIKYLFLKRYTITIIDRNANSLIPDNVERLPYTEFDRRFETGGLHHFVFQMYF